MNKTSLFMKGWTFAKVEGIDHAKPTSFLPVELPHDWLIDDTADLYQNSVGWYRNEVDYNGEYKHVSLRFDGVYMNSTLYINGKEAGRWAYGYSAFEFEITDFLEEGSNLIELKVVHEAPNSRWYSGAGIYRNVWLINRGPEYIPSDGIYVSTTKKDGTYTLEVDTDIVRNRDQSEPLLLTHKLIRDGMVHSELSVDVSEAGTVTLKENGLSVVEWSPEQPELYILETTLQHKGSDEVIEQHSQKVGFKTIDMLPDKGLYLNGRHYKIKGFCEHHDLGALGAAFNPAAMRYRLSLFKDMGVNAIRTSHNMPVKELMELADEMGFLIASESFDMWERSKTTYDYARFFKDWAYKDVKSWVLRDRNHVSLLLWTIGNEIYDTHADKRGAELTRQLKGWVETFDPKGNARVTLGSNYMPWENAQQCADIVKIAGYNYGEKYYDDHHEEHPDWVIYGSETGSVVQSRGIYHFPYQQSVLADDDEQCSSLGNSSTSWGAKSPEAILTGERDRPYSMGQFVWTGFDYIGEPTPYHTKNAYFGQIDTANFPKDSYYIYQSAWTEFKDKPVLHLFPYWDFNIGQTIDVRVATNAPRVELFLNDRKIGEREIDHSKDKSITPTWQVPYETGELKAVAYDHEGNRILEQSRHSFKDTARLTLEADKPVLEANARDLIFVAVSAEDEDGHPVDNATDRVMLTVTGAGRLVGFDNGDSTDYDQYKGSSRRLFSGKAMAVIQATDETGVIHIKAEAEGVQTAELDLTAVKAPGPVEHEVLAQNTERPVITGQISEVPVRKIELISDGGRKLTSERPSVTVRAVLHPSSTTYSDIQWSVVNDAGVEAGNVRLIADEDKATVEARGDGTFRVRCTTQNGTGKIRLISELDMTVEGIGTAYKNPYALVSGSLYDDSEGDVSNGNERGVATGRLGETIVGYHEIDFGRYGSDTITLPVFALSDEAYVIDIWEGHPKEEGSTHLLDAQYQKESKWNVYQEETYKLKKRLKGITSLYFVMHAKVHLKGFYFKKQNRAFSYNSALDADHIYGDAFNRTDSLVTDIGNNVSLVFEDMDLSKKRVSQIRLRGHSPIDLNTIHIRFQSEDGEPVNQVVEFTETTEVTDKVFDLDPIEGEGTLTFVFLPGSQFDFEGFQLLS